MQIKCIMDENAGPPCKRCAEKNLVSILCTSMILCKLFGLV